MFPLWGAIVGAVGAEIFIWAASSSGGQVAAGIAALFWIVVSRFDAFFVGFSRAWIASVILGACWFAALPRLDASHVLASALAAHIVSRAGAIGLAWTSRPAAVGFQLSSRLNWQIAVLALAQGFIASLILGVREGPLLIAASYLVLRMVQAWCYRRRGGIDPTVFTGSQAALEILALVIAITFPN